MAQAISIPKATRDANLAWAASKVGFSAAAAAAKYSVPVKTVNKVAAQSGVNATQIAKINQGVARVAVKPVGKL